jgi:hypothetical protein
MTVQVRWFVAHVCCVNNINNSSKPCVSSYGMSTKRLRTTSVTGDSMHSCT